MAQMLWWGAIGDPTEWPSQEPVLKSPFNMENLLNADADLLAAWKKRPFILDYGYDGNVTVKFWDEQFPTKEPTP